MTNALNVNAANCIKTTTDFGVDHVYNICTGAVFNMPWGSVDWLLYFGAIGFFSLFGVALIGVCVCDILGLK